MLIKYGYEFCKSIIISIRFIKWERVSRMKKKILSCVIICVMLLGGCQNTSTQYLSFEVFNAASESLADYQLSQADFFSKDLVIIQEEANIGGDTALTSGASLLVNVSDQETVYADHVYDKLYPASLTKLLTALVVLRYGELTDSVTISYNASHITEVGAKVCGFEEGDVLTLDALLNSLLIYSGNDAAIAAAEHVGGSVDAFVEIMNEEAVKIGAVHSHFVNPNGLHDDDHYTSAYDMYLIFNELLEYDTFRSMIGSSSCTINYEDKDGTMKQNTFDATNQYISGKAEAVDGLQVIGGKTGTTSKAGNCLILLSKDLVENEYISVILKAPDSNTLYSQMSHLLTKAVDQ